MNLINQYGQVAVNTIKSNPVKLSILVGSLLNTKSCTSLNINENTQPMLMYKITLFIIVRFRRGVE